MVTTTRFAPSPTGFLHIGGARTALFNYLYARHHLGKFLLRIEDTDKARSSQQAVETIFASLKWLGLNWDGDVVFQSQNNDRHLEAAHQLLAEGKAYYCFTPQAEIEQQRHIAAVNKQNFIFKSPWRDANPSSYPSNIKPVIRLKSADQGQTIIQDRLQGNISIENIHLDDMVLVRGDNTATYMLAVVVDDHDMQITHIIRGDDHLTNAARQIQLYEAFGWQVPEMVHIPLIHDCNGAKLSKRNGAIGVDAYEKMGYLPEAICNYLLRLGWSHGNDEIISMDNAIKWFDINGLGLSPARLDFAKMKHLNAHYLRNKSNDELVEIVVNQLKPYSVTPEEQDYIRQGMEEIKIRAELTDDLTELAKIYLTLQPVRYSDEAREVIINCNYEHINQVIDGLNNLLICKKDVIHDMFKNLAAINNLKVGEFIRPIRALITGSLNSPSISSVIEIMGVKNIISRLKKISEFKNQI